ncbi:uncharacterized protein F5147DRAFT_654630 [Suillus discolor]|uniref:Uncharacterized protein n=1 Tax=Suillus discolor TaxID=1912936 RepID=A0A9P7F268_9AGAM|nr:uncharacterized protein F5147DRAFT_654630 [Suillus discolor]KAG2103718.1 hypothetical protein F5147DRAFT_654630 [Suillus discolor]
MGPSRLPDPIWAHTHCLVTRPRPMVCMAAGPGPASVLRIQGRAHAWHWTSDGPISKGDITAQAHPWPLQHLQGPPLYLEFMDGPMLFSVHYMGPCGRRKALSGPTRGSVDICCGLPVPCANRGEAYHMCYMVGGPVRSHRDAFPWPNRITHVTVVGPPAHIPQKDGPIQAIGCREGRLHPDIHHLGPPTLNVEEHGPAHPLGYQSQAHP